jgi:hypothetical protein
MNALSAHFSALAEGYIISHQDGEDPDTKSALANARNTQKAAEKAAVLAANPITDAQYEEMRRTRSLTAAASHGHQRFIIETG